MNPLPFDPVLPSLARLVDAPAMGAEIGKDQPLAWNIGTTGITRSAAPSPKASTWLQTRAWMTLERCE